MSPAQSWRDLLAWLSQLQRIQNAAFLTIVSVSTFISTNILWSSTMRSLSTAPARAATETPRTTVQPDEHSFGDVLSQVASVLWPRKTAAHLAAKAGCTERAVEFYFSGDREWSGPAVTAIVSEILTRHAMRSVKGRARQTAQ